MQELQREALLDPRSCTIWFEDFIRRAIEQ